jgi:bla regulator protein blaR1
VLLHELAHVARHDCLTQTLAALMCALYWMHPGAWWIARRLRVERELACDDRVVSTGTDAQDYAGHLLELAYALRPAAPALAVTMAAPGQLEGRLRALLDTRRRRGVPRLHTRLAAGGLMTLLLGVVSGATLSNAAAVAAAEGNAAPLLAIQDAAVERFDVASVRPNTSTETGGFIQAPRGPSFSVGNQTLGTLIGFAYELQRGQLVGQPAWVNTERYDIVAKAERDIPPGPALRMMLRSLLADRFKLAVHRETRETPIYALVMARSDGQPGPRLRRPANDHCAQRRAASAKGQPPPPLSADPVCGIRGNQSELTAGSYPLSSFTAFLAGTVRRPVVDRTGLSGEWDFDLKWNPDPASTDTERPSIFTALQEQLGLKLEATTGPVDVLVVDRVERPVPD